MNYLTLPTLLFSMLSGCSETPEPGDSIVKGSRVGNQDFYTSGIIVSSKDPSKASQCQDDEVAVQWQSESDSASNSCIKKSNLIQLNSPQLSGMKWGVAPPRWD